MAAYLLCLSAGGGVPLFTRTKGDLKPLPFPVIGSLNGVHMFASTHDVSLLSTTTVDAKVVWKVFHDSITLILVSRDDNASDSHLQQLIEKVFLSMVLVYGLDDLTNIKNIERFKKEIKVCFKLVDSLLDQADLDTFSDLTDSVDVVLGPENSILQEYLDAFVEAAASPYGCLLVWGKVAVATRKWWSLSSVELVLLSLLVNSLPKCSARDIPIFLPHGSPKVPHRLLTFQLVQGVEVCVVCGPTPSLAELQREVDRFWRTAFEYLKSSTRIHPRNFPTSILTDQSILGFILINRESHRCLCTVEPMEEDSSRQGKTMSIYRRREILRAFYKSVVRTIFTPPQSDMDSTETADTLHTRLKHKALETYIVSETHKCFAMNTNPYELYVLYSIHIPTYALRSTTTKLLSSLIKEKTMQV
ncbi:protein fuzzy homolog [Lingula anatina]|uniref:Protein fuzzy homolog n=1 Tax=Lingula anatina TaxID=7574 RepID=A0A1S3HXP4_LINAN|nr:protein fuzzy homolog [Lingula anatina]XP_013398686.1 protein fuzzy homolog [Lingula anatina]|eukprot:XP_013390800.1 protein fuzzy homolog [Lingula anatina]